MQDHPNVCNLASTAVFGRVWYTSDRPGKLIEGNNRMVSSIHEPTVDSDIYADPYTSPKEFRRASTPKPFDPSEAPEGPNERRYPINPNCVPGKKFTVEVPDKRGEPITGRERVSMCVREQCLVCVGVRV